MTVIGFLAVPVLRLLAAGPAVAASPGATVFTAAVGPGGGVRVEHALRPRDGGGNIRLAYGIEVDAQGMPVIQAYSFILSEVVFSRDGGLYPWPALCEYQWGWNPLTRRLVSRCAAGLMQEPECALRGTVAVTGFLSPRIDVKPDVTMTVESERESVPLPVRVVLHDPRRVSWTGIPVIMAELSTTTLEDGEHRLRVDGGFREFRIDGDPATTLFEDGGDATVRFLVHNRPPRLVSLSVFAASATAYRGAWRRVRTGGLRYVLDRTGGDAVAPPGAQEERAVIELGFSVPVSRVTVEARRAGGGRVTAEITDRGEAAPPAEVWRAAIPWRAWRPGAWTFRITAETDRGIPLEPLAGDTLAEAAMGRLDPDSGRCAACRTGADESHRVRVIAPR